MSLYRSSVGKKILMAVSGAVLVGFVLGHMAGNLKVFLGAESFDHYAEFLREVGEPLAPRGTLLWIARLGLLAALFIHVAAALQLTRMSRIARPTAYEKREALSFSYASRTMRWGGVILLLFVIYHLAHFTFGVSAVHPDFVRGSPYHNLVTGFQNPVVALLYIVAVGALSLHMHHGIWSAFQTLGLSHAKYDRFRRPLAMVIALVLFIGFSAVPVAVMTGIVS